MNKWKAKKAQEKQRETLKDKQKCPFSGGKLVFVSLRSKERKQKTTPPPPKKTKQTNKKTRRV